MLTGTSRTTVQVSSADAMWLTCASGPGGRPRADRAAGCPRVRPSVPTGAAGGHPASTGTTTLVSAPPSTMS